MTISHPAKVKVEVLSSGVDTLVLSLYVDWDNVDVFDILSEGKERAQEYDSDAPANIKHFNPGEVFPVNVKPNGAKGFAWIISNSDYAFTIADKQHPGSRPNVMVEIRSETLWRLGPGESVIIALKLVEANGGHIIEAKLSRVDLCLDFAMPEKNWSWDLMEYAVTRAADFNPYYSHRKLNGIRIGAGGSIILARLYDKVLEIEKSKKYWLFDVWKIKERPAGKKIIRLEFQMRREMLKQLGLKTVEDLLEKTANAWAYCTKEWLKFQDRPGLHHTQRSTFEWYRAIQEGFQGVQGAEPLVRVKAVRMDKMRLLQQTNGLLTSLHAIILEEQKADRSKPVGIGDCLDSYNEELRKHQEPLDIQARIEKKRAKFHREESAPKIEAGQTVYVIRKAVE